MGTARTGVALTMNPGRRMTALQMLKSSGSKVSSGKEEV